MAEETWYAGMAEWAGEIALLRVRGGKIDREGRTHWVAVTTTYESERAFGLPEPEQNLRLQELEDDLEGSTDGRAVFVGTRVGGLQKVLYFYAPGQRWLRDWATAQRRRIADVDMRFEVAEDGTWQRHERLMRAARRAYGDRVAIAKLDELNVDRTQIHRIDCTMVFRDQQSTDAATATLREHDYDVHVDRKVGTRKWFVLASLRDRPAAPLIAHLGAMLSDFAESYGGEYDGWGVALDPHVTEA